MTLLITRPGAASARTSAAVVAYSGWLVTMAPTTRAESTSRTPALVRCTGFLCTALRPRRARRNRAMPPRSVRAGQREEAHMTTGLLTLRDVTGMTALSRSAVYALMAESRVPTGRGSRSSGLAVEQTVVVAIRRYCAVVARLRCPSRSWMVRRSVPASSRWTANAWRKASTHCSSFAAEPGSLPPSPALRSARAGRSRSPSARSAVRHHPATRRGLSSLESVVGTDGEWRRCEFHMSVSVLLLSQ